MKNQGFKTILFILNIKYYMKCMNPQEIALAGTAIAMELARGKSKDELKQIKALVQQVQATLLTLIGTN